MSSDYKQNKSLIHRGLRGGVAGRNGDVTWDIEKGTSKSQRSLQWGKKDEKIGI